MIVLDVGSDNLLRWDEMTLASSGAYVNDATVTWALKTAAGVSIATGSLTYVDASNGRYDGVCESTVELTAGQTYYLEITAVSGGANGFRRIECFAAYQDED